MPPRSERIADCADLVATSGYTREPAFSHISTARFGGHALWARTTLAGTVRSGVGNCGIRARLPRSSNSGSVTQASVENFLTYANRRRVLMAIGGVVAIAAGVTGIAITGGGSSSVWLGGLAVFGLIVTLGAGAGASMLKDVKRVAGGSSVKMELTTWPYRTVKSPLNNRVQVTLDCGRGGVSSAMSSM